ncbi:MAG: hypothetical protein ABSC76_15495 [Terracidiphilus sp.]|jgi:hypothetical protein
MKKLVFASVMALASITLVSAPMLRAQDSITIKDPQEFNAYQMANTQTDAKTKAGQLEDFLTKYPQSVVKAAVLDSLIDTYQSLQDADHTLSAASRLLQVDPNNMKAIFISVFIKKSQCAKTSDAQTCDDAAALAQKGLVATKPAGTSDDDWKKMTGGTYTAFHSAIALDNIVSKKDFKAGISEYRTELMLYPAAQTTGGPGLWDTLQLAEAYIKQEAVDSKLALQTAAKAKAATDPAAKVQADKDAKDAKDADGNDLVQAVWFYARAWNFAPASLKTPIETKMKFYYTKYHGNVEGLDAVKTQAAATVFPPGTFVLSAAPTPAEIVHKLIVETTDLNSLALSDKEFVLANGNQEDVDKLWALMKGKATPVPGEVISATASVIQLAVSPDAKGATPEYADFIVNLKTPLADKDIPAAKVVYGIQPAAELDGTYDSYTQVPATETSAQTAQIVLKDGVIVPEKKKPVATHKPSAAHHPAAH